MKKLLALTIVLCIALVACNKSGEQLDNQQSFPSGQTAGSALPEQDTDDRTDVDSSESDQPIGGGNIGDNRSTSDADSKAADTTTGMLSTIVLVAPPDNTVYSETVMIEATGDSVTHIQITTGSDIHNSNNDFALKSYQHWLPILRDHYSSHAGFAFSADEAAGTWTIDADITDDALKVLAEYYVDLSGYKSNGRLSKELLVYYYKEVLRYTEGGE